MGKDCHNCMTVCELWILMLWNVCKWCDYWLTCVVSYDQITGLLIDLTG